MRGSPYTVVVCDLFHGHDPDHQTFIPGFPAEEVAVEYARRRTWSSVEEMKAAGRSPEEVREHWLALGEECWVVGPEGNVVYRGRAELETFIRHPIPPDRRDWLGLYQSLLPQDFHLVYEWAAGTVPPPHHYEYTVEVGPGDRGQVVFWPDYPGRDVPRWTHTFRPTLENRILLVNWLRATNWRENPPSRPDESAVGGETGQLKVTSGGKQATIQVHLLPEEERQTVHRAVCLIVPEHVWTTLDQQRQQYIERVYGG